jgi:adenosine deaminase
MQALAEKRGIPLHEAFCGSFPFQGLPHFMEHYDNLNDLYIRGQEDYALLAKDYLLRMAAEGAIYCDLIASPAHAAISGLSCEQMIDAINKAIEEAHAQTGIRATISITAVRAPSNLPDAAHAGHFKKYGPDHALKYARETAALKQSNPAKCIYLTSFGIAGNECYGGFAEFKPAIDVAREAQLIIRAHAGEVEPGSVRSAMTHLNPEVIDHGLAIVRDPELMADIAKKGIRVTSAITSNELVAAIHAHDPAAMIENHPLWALREAGIQVGLGGDDNLFFDTSIKNEYRKVLGAGQKRGHMQPVAMMEFTKAAINMPFVPEWMRQELQEKVKQWERCGQPCYSERE